jgi:hypothetical protein
VEARDAGGGVRRVRWREGQRLDAGDLTDQQAYLVTAGHRHGTGPHEWGIVTGLKLSAAPQGLGLGHGFAVDGYGRELVVGDDLVLPWAEVEPPPGQGGPAGAIDIWLRYCRVAGPDRSRVREEARLRLTVATQQPVDPRTPPGVPVADLTTGAVQVEEPSRPWPVYLGRIARRPPGDPVPFRLAAVRRPYAGLRGAVVDGLPGRARLELGGSAADRLGLAIRTEDDKGGLVRRVEVDADGRLSAHAGAELRGVGLVGGMIRPASLRLLAQWPNRRRTSAQLGFAEPLPPPPEQAWPWRIYRTKAKVDDRELDQLRIEIQHPGETDDPARYRLVVGRRGVSGQFEPSLTVRANGIVTVEGHLVPKGPVTQGAAGAGIGADGSGVVLDDILRKLAAGTITIDAAFGGARVETGILRIDLDAAGLQPRVDRAFQYTVTLVNSVTRLVGHVEACQTTAFGLVVSRPAPVASGLQLAGGASSALAQQLYVPQGSVGQRLTVSVVALGIDTTGTLAYAAQTRTWTVIP